MLSQFLVGMVKKIHVCMHVVQTTSLRKSCTPVGFSECSQKLSSFSILLSDDPKAFLDFSLTGMAYSGGGVTVVLSLMSTFFSEQLSSLSVRVPGVCLEFSWCAN